MGDGGWAGHLTADSGMMAVVDPVIVDDFLAAIEDLLDGARPESSAFRLDGGGFWCATGGDGQFRFEPDVVGEVVTGFRIIFDDRQDLAGRRWIEAGAVDVPSGILLIGDPGALSEYMPDPIEPPFDVSAWAVGRPRCRRRASSPPVPIAVAVAQRGFPHRCGWIRRRWSAPLSGLRRPSASGGAIGGRSGLTKTSRHGSRWLAGACEALVVVSPSAAGSPWVQWEIHYALDLGKTLVPIGMSLAWP